MKICYDQGCNDTGVVIATKWRCYLFYLQQFISALGTVLPKSLFKVLSPSLILTWTAVTNNVFDICKNASYCCARKYENCPFFTVFLTIKTSSQDISIMLLQISLKLYERRGRYWRKTLPWTILEEQFSVLRYTSASEIGCLLYTSDAADE